jgi:starch synthase
VKVAFAASEAVPYAKTGGLADVIGSLPHHLRSAGAEVKVFLPRYKGIPPGTSRVQLSIPMQETSYEVTVHELDHFIFIDYPPYYDRKGLYGTAKGDHKDNFERFTLFCKTVCAYVRNRGYDIIHCHDWQTGLIPLFLHDQQAPIRSIFTIHNLGYQGRFPKEKYDLLDVDRSYFTSEGIEYYDDINCLKAGIVYSNAVTTVSENYAREIQTPEFGFGLDGILRTRRKDLSGIVNGIDHQTWDPGTDPHLYATYTDYQGKLQNKRQLLHDCAMCREIPLIGMVSRIAAQKGFDILIKCFDEIMNMDLSLIILGYGDETYHRKLEVYQRLYPKRFSLVLKFDNTLAHRIYGASDFFLMPSQYEPCGLGQMISLRYGAVPIVRFTGGLADTISDYDCCANEGNGFSFTEYRPQELSRTVLRAVGVYKNKEEFVRLSEKCMKMDYSWAKSAKKYMKLYEKILSR